MRIDIITVLPEMIEGFFNYSIIAVLRRKELPRFISITCAIMRTTVTVRWTIIRSGDVPAW